MNESNEEIQVPSAETKPESMNLLQRVIGVFNAPKQTFEDISARPDWVFPLILMIVVTIIMTQLMVPAIIEDYKSSERFEKFMTSDQLTPEQAESAQGMYISTMKKFTAVSAGVTTAISSILAAAILLFIGNIILGGNAKFRQIFAIYCWGGLVGLLGLILRTPLALGKMSTKVYFSPAVLFPLEAEETVLFKIAAALDVFIIWRVILLAIGFTAVYKIAFGKSMATLGGLYALLVIISLAFSGAL